MRPVHFCGRFWRPPLFAAESIAEAAGSFLRHILKLNKLESKFCNVRQFCGRFEAEQVGEASFASCANFVADLVKRNVSCRVKDERGV